MEIEIKEGETQEEFLARCRTLFESQQLPPEAEMLFEQAQTAQPRVDRALGILHHVRIMGNVSKNGYTYSREGMLAATPLFEGLCVGINHDYSQKPLKVEDAWGTISNPTFEDDSIWGDLTYLKKHILTEQILEDVERNTRIFALSCANAYPAKDEGKKLISAFRPARVDVVAGGGATTRTLFEQAPAAAAVATAAELEALRQQVAALTTRLDDSEKRLMLHEQYVAPQPVVEQTVAVVEAAAVAKGIDLKKFWAEDCPAY